MILIDLNCAIPHDFFKPSFDDPMIKHVLLVTVFISFHLCLAADAELLSFQQLSFLSELPSQQSVENELPEKLKQLNTHQVRIRGFFYPSVHGGMILAARPDLKSCCVGSSSLVHSQIALRDFVGQVVPGHAQLVEGTFKVVPVKDHQGFLIHLYSLENAVIVSENQGAGLVVACGIVACVCLVLFVLRSQLKSYGKF